MATTLANISIKDSSSWNTYLNLIYPVGSIYIAFTSTSPATRFGGTWSQISGRFLYCTTNTGTGGSNTHTLTISEIPPHNHGIHGGWGAGSIGKSYWRADLNNPSELWNPVELTGGGESHNNMPSYQGVYAWRRTA